MSHIIKLKCNHSTYFDNNSSTASSKTDNVIYTGLVNSNRYGLNMYYSVLSFNIKDIEYDMVQKICLYIYVDTIKFSGTTQSDIGLCCNDDYLGASNYDYNILSDYKFTKVTRLNIPENASKSYVEINVTDIVKPLMKSDGYFNFLFCPLDKHQSTIFKFGSANCPNPPYIKIDIESSHILNDNEDNHNSVKKDNIEFKDKLTNLTYKDSKKAGSHDDSPDESHNFRNINNLLDFSRNTKQQKNSFNIAGSISKILLYLSDQSKTLSLLQDLLQKNNNDSISIDDIDVLNKHVLTLSDNVTLQNNSLYSLKEEIEQNIENNSSLILSLTNSIPDKICSADDISDLMAGILELQQSVTNLKADYDNINSNLCRQNDDEDSDLYRSMIKEIHDNSLSYNDILNSINTSITNISSSYDITAVQKQINELTSAIDDINKSNSDFYYSVAESFSNINAKLSELNNYNTKLENLYNFNNIISESIDDLKKNMTNIKESISEISTTQNNLQKEYDSSKSDTEDLDSVSKQLSTINATLDKVEKIISSLTIEPLN